MRKLFGWQRAATNDRGVDSPETNPKNTNLLIFGRICALYSISVLSLSVTL